MALSHYLPQNAQRQWGRRRGRTVAAEHPASQSKSRMYDGDDMATSACLSALPGGHLIADHEARGCLDRLRSNQLTRRSKRRRQNQRPGQSARIRIEGAQRVHRRFRRGRSSEGMSLRRASGRRRRRIAASGPAPNISAIRCASSQRHRIACTLSLGGSLCVSRTRRRTDQTESNAAMIRIAAIWLALA